MVSPGQSIKLRPVSARRSVVDRSRSFGRAAFDRVLRVPPRLFDAIRGRAFRARSRRQLAARNGPLRLCIGSGAAPIPGWVNIDISPPADVLLDVRYGLPLPDASVERIYSEHVVEHLDVADGLALMREWRRTLAPGGVVRIATPDLEYVVSVYRSTWKEQDWVNWPEYAWIDTGVRMLNASVRLWGHQYLYDFDELALRLRQAGFTTVTRCALGESEHPDLQGLETRLDSRLIVEASIGSSIS